MKNKGYTLIELIIVLAIMAILTGLAFVSIGVIHQAKYNAAANTLNNQMSNLWIQTKTLSQAVSQTSASVGSSEYKKNYPMCMQIKRNTDETYSLIFGYNCDTDNNGRNDKFYVASSVQPEATLPKIIKLEYIESEPEQLHPENVYESDNKTISNMIVEFDKADGSVNYGAGTYNIVYDNRTVISIQLDSVTGKHYIK